ncbi:MAG: metal-dependent hydrolase [Archaeoglobaceae archaeon]
MLDGDMNRFGHLGFSLLIFSPLLSLFSFTEISIAVIFSLLPDIDLILKVEHRRYTHNITFALIMALIFFLFLNDILVSAFIFAGIFSHILADLFTKKKFAPFYPLSNKKFALGLFRSDNLAVNYSLLFLGLFSFAYFSNIISIR